MDFRMYLYSANLPDLSEKGRSGFPVYPKGLSVRCCPCIQNRKRIRQAAACYTKIETAETAGKKDRAWVVDGNQVTLEVLAPVVVEEDKAEALEVGVLEAPVPVGFEEDKVEALEASAPVAFEEDKVEALVVFEEDKVEALETLAVDRTVVRKEVPAAVLEVSEALAADRTDNTENRAADREPALASAVLAGEPAYA